MIAVVAVLLLGGLSRGELPATITFTHPCDRAEVLLEALGEELNLNLKPSGSVNKDYFFVGFKDVSAQVIFDKIAETLNAKWVRKGNVTYLTRSSDMDKAEVQAGKDLMREALPAMLDSDKTLVRGAYGLDEATDAVNQIVQYITSKSRDYQRRQRILQTSPANRLLKSFTRSLGVDRIMAQDYGQDYVYSTRPTYTNLPVPHDLQPLIDAFVKEMEVHVEAVTRAGADQMRNGPQGYFEPALPRSVRISVRRSLSTVSARIDFSREGGWWTQVAWLNLAMAGPKRFQLDQQGVKFTVPQTGHAILKGLKDRSMQWPREPEQPVPDAIVEKMLAMPDYEPLTDIASAPFERIAELTGKSVIAVVPDGFLSSATWFAVQEEQDLDAFLRVLALWWIGYREDEKFIQFKPQYPSSIRASRIDRKAVADFIRRYRKENRLTIDGVADLLESTRQANGNVSYLIYLRTAILTSIALPDVLHGQQSLWSGVLALYSALPSQTQAAAHDGWIELDANRLSPLLAQRLRSMLKRENVPILGITRPTEPDWRNGRTVAIEGARSTDSLLAGPLPFGTVVAIRVQSDTHISPSSTSGEFFSGIEETVESMAQHYYRMQRGQVSGHMDFSRIRLKPVQRLVIRLELPGGQAASFWQQVTSLRYGDLGVPPDKLPEPLKKRFFAAVADYEKKYGGGSLRAEQAL